MDIRNEILKAVENEVVGPHQNPDYRDEATGEEILLASVHGSPKSRYGAGMLYPKKAANCGISDSGEEIRNDLPENQEPSENEEIEKPKKSLYNSEDEIDEEPVGMANQYLPSAMGFTVQFKSDEDNDQVRLTINSAYYEKGKLKKPKKQVDKNGNVVIPKNKDGNTFDSDYWIRRPIQPEPLLLNLNSLFPNNEKSFIVSIKKNSKEEDWLKLQIFNRTTTEDRRENILTLTFVIINVLSASTDDAVNSINILFQNELILSTDNEFLIVPYKERILASDTDEEKELNMLYRNKRIFSIGHGTSVNWTAEETKTNGRSTVKEIKTSTIPVYDLPQVAPTSHVALSMFELSDLGNWESSKKSLDDLKNEYRLWIEEFEYLAANSDELENYREAAKANVEKCKISLNRISKGIDLLINADENSDIVKCFRWMNRAMIWQQQRSKAKIRKWHKSGTGKSQTLVLDHLDEDKKNNDFESLAEFHKGRYNGKWRPFQLAFILMNIESIINSKSKEREIVDLIWFPTGGGKTEAYLGLTAFNIFYRRMKGNKKSDWSFYGGTAVLMRYTLRLLTTQQYERAASLICACDLIRIENKKIREEQLDFGELGDEPISIGLWVGGTSTPNDNDTAKAQLNDLKNKTNAEYNFVVMKCPCCGAQIGKVDNVTSFDSVPKIIGLHKEDGAKGKVYFQCENTRCEYSKIPLPLQIIDELIYNAPPTLLLGTVDKFAMIPWKREAGKIFGFRKDDPSPNRITPPELIIQDELHLIAGPLGTMVGLYETMVQTLCNDYNKAFPPFIRSGSKEHTVPKIIASSATIRRAHEQVKNLYAIDDRSKMSIFPAQGPEFGHTWFSKVQSLNDMEENGNQRYPGRKYIGVLASGYPSAQTAIVRTYAMVLQKVKELSQTEEPKNIDYYWTLLGYFNSIRELGGASSLVYGDIKERLGQIQNRDLTTKNYKRFISRIEELTSRISSSEIPAILKKLETKLNSGLNNSLDICLATNMVATGVDISRLGLMFIHGQPKTTAEYIQASSRVGRDVPSGAGLIFTLYSPSKPRDKSQYEQFQSYHSRIYSNVEPTSVTPFSINARQKGLHSVLIGLVRHFSSGTLTNSPTITSEFYELAEIFKEIIRKRCDIIDREESDNTLKLLSNRIESWKNSGAQEYGDAANSKILKEEGYYPLMYATSAEVREETKFRQTPFPTSTSMRGVDTESVLSINSNYNQDE